MVGQQNNSYFFNGGDFVDCTVDMSEGAEELLQPAEGVTLEAWVNHSFSGTIENFTGVAHYLTLNGATNESGFALMYYEGAWRFVVSVTGDIDIFGSGLQVWPGAVLDADEWQHIAGTYDNATGEAKIFLNGSLQETHITGGGDIDWEDINTQLFIGRGTTNADEVIYMEGAIDEVRVWSTPRTQAEIQANMYQVIEAVDNLEAYWNFNDNQSTTVSDQTGNGYNGSLDESGSGDWHDDVFTQVSGDCEDYVITELPYFHSDTTTGQGDDWYNNWGAGQSDDIAYKITLDEPRRLYISTCDSLTDFDTMLAVKSFCNEKNSLMEIDDWDGENDCVETIGSLASCWEDTLFNEGTYYIIVEGYESAAGSYGLSIGAVPEIIGSTISSDDSYIEIFFNDPIYTNGEATDAVNENDFNFVSDVSEGTASDIELENLTTTSGNPLQGGEDTIRFNINVIGVSAGVETVTITPASSSSIFNSSGIGVSGSSTVTQQLNDYSPPVINFNPADGDTISPSDDLVIDFGETITLSDGTPADNNNIDQYISLQYTDSGDEIGYEATLSDEDSRITVNPSGPLNELEWIRLTVSTNSFADNFGNLVTGDVAIFLVRDFSAPELHSASLSSDNTTVSVVFSEGVYTNPSGNGGLNIGDFDITFSSNGGSATDITLSSITNNSGTVPSGGETELKLVLDVSGTPSGEETILIRPENNSSIYDVFGNALSGAENTGQLKIFDKLAPTSTISPENGSMNVLESTNITITYTEPLRFADGSEVTNSFIDTLITLRNNNENGVNISFDAIISGDKDVITINPNADLNSWQLVYAAVATGLSDTAGNAVSGASTTFRSRDAEPPTLVGAILSNQNEYVDLYISESLFGNNDGSGEISTEDLTLTFSQNSGNASFISIASLSNTTNNQLSGGEDTIRVHLNIDGAASGVETVEIGAMSNSVFDVGGNALPTTETTGSLQLFDALVPSVDTVSVENRSKIDYNKSHNITLTFSEGITSMNFSVRARNYPSLSFTSDTTETELTITLFPPLRALDTIDIDIVEIIDNAGLTTVDLFYEFYTPAMGDYDWNDTIDVLDLNAFVNGWRNKDYEYELGPVRGNIPHFLPEFDSEFGLDDGMVFTQMWGWAQENFGWGEVYRPPLGNQPDWSQKIIPLPPSVMSGQIMIQYDPSTSTVDLIPPAFGSNGISLIHHNEIQGKFLVEFGRFEAEEIVRNIQLSTDIDDPGRMTLAHIYYDENENVYSSGTKQLEMNIPSRFKLYANYPNPFNPETTIRYAVSEAGLVTITVFDINGREIETLVQENHEPGFYTVNWVANNAASGVYFCRLTSGNKILNSKLLLVK